jgi:hypothetical protein
MTSFQDLHSILDFGIRFATLRRNTTNLEKYDLSGVPNGQPQVANIVRSEKDSVANREERSPKLLVPRVRDLRFASED